MMRSKLPAPLLYGRKRSCVARGPSRLVEQRAVGGDREAQRDAAPAGKFDGALRHRLDHRPVDQRLAAEKGERGLAAVAGFRQQQVDSPVRGLERHVFGLAAERALLRIAIGAAEVAFLGDGE